MKSFMTTAIMTVVSANAFALELAEEPTNNYGYKKNRIAYTCDGNKGDTDDFGASPAALAILAKAGLQKQLVHFDYNNHLGKSDDNSERQMRLGVNGGIQRWGFNKSAFFDDMVDVNGAVRNLTSEINASTKGNPLYLVLAGPCEVAYRAASNAEPGKCKHVYLLSHSGYNDRYRVPIENPHTKEDLVALGCRYMKIKDQNGSIYPDRLYDSGKDFSVWSWLRDHNDKDLQWLYTRVRSVGRGDVSDSGMIYFLLTGDQDGSPSKLKFYFGNGIKTKPISKQND